MKYEWSAGGKSFTPISVYRVAKDRHERLIAMKAPRVILANSKATLDRRFEQALRHALTNIIATSK